MYRTHPFLPRIDVEFRYTNSRSNMLKPHRVSNKIHDRLEIRRDESEHFMDMHVEKQPSQKIHYRNCLDDEV